MSEQFVQRYSPRYAHDIVQMKDGSFVKYEAYKALTRQRNGLLAMCEDLMYTVEAIMKVDPDIIIPPDLGCIKKAKAVMARAKKKGVRVVGNDRIRTARMRLEEAISIIEPSIPQSITIGVELIQDALTLLVEADKPICNICKGSKRKPREKHCELGHCIKRHEGITCSPDGINCEYYIPSEPCTKCQQKEPESSCDICGGCAYYKEVLGMANTCYHKDGPDLHIHHTDSGEGEEQVCRRKRINHKVWCGCHNSFSKPPLYKCTCGLEADRKKEGSEIA